MKNPNPQSNSTGKFQIKKEITDFLKDEKGFVSKATMLKVGLTTLSGLTLLSGMEAHARTEHTSNTGHQNVNPAITALSSEGDSVTISHTNHYCRHSSSHDSY